MLRGSIPSKVTLYSKYACTNRRTMNSCDDIQYMSSERQASCQICVYFVNIVSCTALLSWHLTYFSVAQFMHKAALPSFYEGGVAKCRLSIRHSPAL
jgi:hypothetical protein